MASKIRKGDKVVVITGKDKGKSGEVLRVLHSDDRVLVRGVNVVTIHKKPTSQTPGQRIKEERPIHISNIAFLEDEKPVKVGFEIVDGKKNRISRKTRKKIG
ncbi:MAG: 50S ribosomal protein L24 [Rickettsiales bacterium]|jgi:large subunit ribosomal protein L24|nr:50S ribosomal protein L24 [Rickettsiales bacterium]